MTRSSGTYPRIYAVVRRIPRGCVATYGQVAALAGLGGQARQVGYALHALDDEGVPWHRVLNARGEVSPRAEPGFEEIQRSLLQREGIVFDRRGRVDLERHRWKPGSRPGAQAKSRIRDQSPARGKKNGSQTSSRRRRR